MNKLEKSRELLKKYFRESPKDVLKQKFERYNQMRFEGETAINYFSNFAQQYTHFDNFVQKSSIYPNTWKELVFLKEEITIFPVKINLVPVVVLDKENYFTSTIYSQAA